jgi:hypothetical protein
MEEIKNAIAQLVAESIRKNAEPAGVDLSNACLEPITAKVLKEISGIVERETTLERQFKIAMAKVRPTTPRKKGKGRGKSVPVGAEAGG